MTVSAHSNLTIGNVHIRQDEAGRYCLNDLHKAAGGEKRHLPSRWLENQQTQDLIAEIANSLVITKTGIPVLEQIQPVITIHGGSNAGTYAAKELVYAYAMWISPSFHLVVIRAYDAMVNSSRAVALLSRCCFTPGFSFRSSHHCQSCPRISQSYSSIF